MHGYSLPWFTTRLPEATQLKTAKGLVVGQINDGRQADRIIKETVNDRRELGNRHEAPWHGQLLPDCTELRDATGALLGQFIDGRLADEILGMVNQRTDEAREMDDLREVVKLAKILAEKLAQDLERLTDVPQIMRDDASELILTLS